MVPERNIIKSFPLFLTGLRSNLGNGDPARTVSVSGLRNAKRVTPPLEGYTAAVFLDNIHEVNVGPLSGSGDGMPADKRGGHTFLHARLCGNFPVE
jgi:hypothetical protein